MFEDIQFTIKESTKDWKKLGNIYHYIQLLAKEDKAKIVYFYTETNPPSNFEFEFATEPDTLDKLYNIISEKLAEKAIEKLTLEFPEGNMYLIFDKTIFGKHYFQFAFDNTTPLIDSKNTTKNERDAWPLGQKDVDTLFGKK